MNLTERRHMRRDTAIALLGGKCVECGSTDKLQFDHVKNDRADVQHNLSQLFSGRWEKALAEVKKCQLLCIYCHSMKTKRDHGFTKLVHGTESMYVNRHCRCDPCRIARNNASSVRKRRAGALRRQLV